VVNEQGETVALDLEVTPELKQAGLAREVVRTLQEARKNAGLEVSDRISVWLVATGELATALAQHGPEVGREVLAVSLTHSEPGPDSLTDGRLVEGADEELGLRYWFTRA
jgi:isoleucyl-tRNA synthetase